jgi:hypothetical protein
MAMVGSVLKGSEEREEQTVLRLFLNVGMWHPESMNTWEIKRKNNE